jgi:hypothetical protein
MATQTVVVAGTLCDSLLTSIVARQRSLRGAKGTAVDKDQRTFEP